jgi:hypothetical protein
MKNQSVTMQAPNSMVKVVKFADIIGQTRRWLASPAQKEDSEDRGS